MILVTAHGFKRKESDYLRQVHHYVRSRRSAARPFSAEGACLIVVDMQRFFIDPRSHASFPAAEGIVRNVRSILEAFRARGLPIVFTRHALLSDDPPGIMGDWWGDVLLDGDAMSSIDDRLRPLAREKVIRKTRYSAFVGTNLDGILWRLGTTRLVITGVQTHLCCESTAREAFMRDYEVFFVVDATATTDEVLHVGSLRALASGFATLTTTKEMTGWLEERR